MTDNAKHIVLRIQDSGVYYNPSQKVEWSNTNFPDKKSFMFSKSRPIYWLVKMISYSTSGARLFLKVVDYNPVDHESYYTQCPKKKVLSLNFMLLDWKELVSIFSIYEQKKFIDLEYNLISKYSLFSALNQVDEEKLYEFYQPFSKLSFKMGFIEFEKKLKGLPEKITIAIPNIHIIPEFELIKSYFGKLFDTKKIKVIGVIGKLGDRSSYNFFSPEIEKIDDLLISGIKKLEIERKILKPRVFDIDKSLFTPEEYFDGIEGELGDRTRKSNYDIINEILALKYIRNRRQLEYISGKLHSYEHKLHFTLTPTFGFLFYVVGKEMNHFIWEMLDSNATYVWSFDKETDKKLSDRLITAEINFIRKNGRMLYLSNIKDNIFNKVSHTHAASKLVDGFPRWRAKINELLV